MLSAVRASIRFPFDRGFVECELVHHRETCTGSRIQSADQVMKYRSFSAPSLPNVDARAAGIHDFDDSSPIPGLFFCLQTEEKGPSGLVSHETVLASVECRFVNVNKEGRFRLSYAIDDSP